MVHLAGGQLLIFFPHGGLLPFERIISPEKGGGQSVLSGGRGLHHAVFFLFVFVLFLSVTP